MTQIKIFKSYEESLSNDFVSPQNSEDLEKVYDEGVYTYVENRGSLEAIASYFIDWDAVFEYLSKPPQNGLVPQKDFPV